MKKLILQMVSRYFLLTAGMITLLRLMDIDITPAIIISFSVGYIMGFITLFRLVKTTIKKITRSKRVVSSEK